MNLIAGQQCPFWTFCVLSTRYLSISKSTLLQDALLISGGFASCKRHSWPSACRLSCNSAYTISELCAVWKPNSWTRANRKPCKTALTVYECIVDWKRDSWASAIEPLCWSAQPILERFALWNAIPEKWLLDDFAGRHYPYLNDTMPKKAIQSPFVSKYSYVKFRSLNSRFFRIRKLIPPAVRHYPYLRVSQLKTWFQISRISTTCRTPLPIYERYAAWKRVSWEVANQPPWKMAVPIFERFAAWKRDSWASANQPPCGRHCPFLIVSQPE